jgi:hypothetical protein
MPVMPAPMTAMWRTGAGGLEEVDFFVMVCFYGCNGLDVNVL